MRAGFWREVASAAVDVVKRYPLVVVSAVLMTGAGHAWVEIGHRFTGPESDLEGTCARFAMCGLLGIPGMLMLQLLRESLPLRWRRAAWLLDAAGVSLLAVYFFSLPPEVQEGPAIHVKRFFLLLAALHFLVAIAPLRGRNEETAFWTFNKTLYIRFALAVFYSGVLYLGLVLAIVSADKLFDLDVEERVYVHLWIFIAGIFNTLFFLAGVPRDPRRLAESETGEYPRALRAFIRFVFVPLVTLYLVILYLYLAKIVVQWEWPNGWVALPVLILAGGGILTALLLYPLREDEEVPWARLFFRWFFPLLLPLAVVLFLSIRVRILDYGVTEHRYLVVILAGWLLLVAAYFAVFRRSAIRWVPASLAMLCLISAFGPWSAFAISRGSQQHRLRSMLEAHGIYRDGVLTPAGHPLPQKDYQDLRSAAQYLVETFGVQSLRPLAPEFVEGEEKKNNRRWDVVENFTKYLALWQEAGPTRRLLTVKLSPGEGIALEGYRKMHRVSSQYGGPREGTLSPLPVDYTVQDDVVTFWRSGAGRSQNKISDFRLADGLKERSFAELGGADIEMSTDQLTFAVPLGDAEARLVVLSARVWVDAQGQCGAESFEALILVP